MKELSWTSTKKRATYELVNEYLRVQGVTQMKFTAIISAALPSEVGVSRQTISNWLNIDSHTPSHGMAFYMSQADGWVGDLGQDLLSLLSPQRHKPASEIGKKIYDEFYGERK